MRWVVACSVSLVVGAAVSAAQEPPQPRPTPTPVFRAGTAVVTVDVVVRDAQGRPVTSFTADQFEVFEDDAPQTVTSFRAPSAAGRSARASRTTLAPPAPAAGAAGNPSLVALVFDRLSNQGRAMAHQAALAYIGTTPTLTHTMGVFHLDLRLDQIQDFTRDRVRVAAGIDAAASRAPWQFGMRRGALDAFEGSGEEALLRATAPTFSGPGRVRPEEDFYRLERDQVGFRTMDQLRQVVANLALVPGRKSVVLFSEGLPLSVNVEPRFQSLLAEANRANVAFYVIDTAGLRTVSTQRMTSIETRDVAAAAGAVSTSDIVGSAVGLLEQNADALLADPASSLGRLAGDTGGFLVQHTNDLEAGFRRVAEDLESHYVLTYSPTNDTYDGTFRRIRVRVREPGVRVVARRGYLATPPAEVAPALSFETQALAALDSTPVPNDFPHLARALQFPGKDGRTRLGVLTETETRHLAYATSGDGARFSAEAVVVVRVRDLRGQVAAKASEVYAIGGDVAGVAQSQRGRLLFFRAPEVPPGAYTVETVVHDTQAGRSSVRFASVDVPAVPSGALQFGDLFLIAAAEGADEDAGRPARAGSGDAASPLRFGALLLYPQISPVLTPGGRKELAFAFVVANATRVQSAQVDVWRGGEPLGTVPLTLDAPDAGGTVRQIFRLPMDTFAPGSYDVRVSLRTADATLTRNTRFTVR